MKTKLSFRGRALAALATSTVLLSGFVAGCGTSTGNGLNGSVSLAFSAYDATAKSFWLLDWLIPSAYASVSNMTFCFQRLRFKTDSAIDNIEFALGLVPIVSSGTTLGNATIPAGTYNRVEFDLDTSCPGGYSIQLTNGNGTFASTDTITISFNGTFQSTGAAQSLPLAVQTITSALNQATSASDIKNRAESASGTF